LHLGVAVAAVDAQLAGVVLVTELYRLLARDALLRDVARAVDERQEPQAPGDEEQRAEDADPRQRVGAAMEGLRHGLLGTVASLSGPNPHTRRDGRKSPKRVGKPC